MKVKRRFRITLDDESHLEQVFSLHLTPWRMVMAGGAVLLCMCVLGVLLVSVTPLRRLLPGHLRAEQRIATEMSIHRLDSLTAVYAENKAFLENLTAVLDIERAPIDSLLTGSLSVQLSPDSLLGTSREEARFVAGMREREKFNLNVMNPVGADGVMFHNVNDNARISDRDRVSTSPEVILPARAPMATVADGTVLGVYAEGVRGGYRVLIQHAKGFVTSYRGMGSVIVSGGDAVKGGQIVGFSPQGSLRRPVYMQMWHDGVSIPPAEYLPLSAD